MSVNNDAQRYSKFHDMKNEQVNQLHERHFEIAMNEFRSVLDNMPIYEGQQGIGKLTKLAEKFRVLADGEFLNVLNRQLQFFEDDLQTTTNLTNVEINQEGEVLKERVRLAAIEHLKAKISA